MRVSVGDGTPELHQELILLDDSARGERLKHLAMLGLIYLKHGPQLSTVSSEAMQPPTPAPTPLPVGLSSVVNKLKLSLSND